MTDHANTILELEALTGHPVPSAWLAVMNDFPSTLARRTYPGVDSRVADHELVDKLERVLHLNKLVREANVWGDEDDEEAPWRLERLAIGRDLSGDIVFLDASRPDPSVQRFIVSSGRVIEMAPDIATLVRLLDTPDVEVPRN